MTIVDRSSSYPGYSRYRELYSDNVQDPGFRGNASVGISKYIGGSLGTGLNGFGISLTFNKSNQEILNITGGVLGLGFDININLATGYVQTAQVGVILNAGIQLPYVGGISSGLKVGLGADTLSFDKPVPTSSLVPAETLQLTGTALGFQLQAQSIFSTSDDIADGVPGVSGLLIPESSGFGQPISASGNQGNDSPFGGLFSSQGAQQSFGDTSKPSPLDLPEGSYFYGPTQTQQSASDESAPDGPSGSAIELPEIVAQGAIPAGYSRVSAADGNDYIQPDSSPTGGIYATSNSVQDAYQYYYPNEEAAASGQALIDNERSADAYGGLDGYTGPSSDGDVGGASSNGYGDGYGGGYGDEYGDSSAGEDDGSDEGGGGGDDGPVVLDLSGKGINITKLSSSNTFQDSTGDGYQNRTAWAGVGNAVLFLDQNGTGTITQANQIDFKDWDPTAATDMQALLDVFDTNHDGKLDAGDADFSQFKVMVTNADGTQTAETLAQAGIASINLTTNNVSQTFSDGSSIDGETTFTTTSGGTGTAATVTFAYDPNSHAVKETLTRNADGSVTVDNKSLNSDGSLASEITSTTSADGLTKTIQQDLNGDGQIDTIQTDDTVVGTNTTTETLTDTTKSGILLDRIVTTTSTDPTSGTVTKITTTDANGGMTGGNYVASQREADVTTAGLTTITLDDLNPDGSLRDRTVTTPGNAGLTETVQQDVNGDGVFDLTTTETTSIDATSGARTTTTTDTNADGSVRDRQVVTSTADGSQKTASNDFNGDGVVDLISTSSIVQNTTSSVLGAGVSGTTTTQVDTAPDGSFIDETVTFVSADGLSKVSQVDLDGGGTAAAPVFDATTSDVTTVDAASGNRTETVTSDNGNGSLRSQTITVRGADGLSRTTRSDTTGAVASDGSSIFDQTETITVGSDGSIVDTARSLAINGELIGQTVTTTSADGLTKTVQEDLDGDGKTDVTTTTTTTPVSGGGSTVKITDQSANGATVDTTTTTTSADGLTVTTQSNVGGNQTTLTDATSVNLSTGVRTETVSRQSANGTLEGRIITTTSADRNTRTVSTDLNGDGAVDSIETIAKQANGSVVDTLSDYAKNGSLISQTIQTTSADGLTVTTTANIDGKIDSTTTDATTLGTDGSRTDAISVRNNDGSLLSQSVSKVSATGLSSSLTTNVDGKVDYTTSAATVLNANGSRTTTSKKTDSTGTTIASSTTTTSANGLASTVATDENGDGTVDTATSDTKVLNADGSTTETVTTTGPGGVLLRASKTTTLADGMGSTVMTDNTGDGTFDDVVTTAKDTSAYVTVTDYTINPNDSIARETQTIVSADGLSKTSEVDLDGDGAIDETQTDVTTLNPDGSRTETVSTVMGSTTTVVDTTTTSANGLSSTETLVKGKELEETVSSVMAYNADGSTTDTRQVVSRDGGLKAQTVTTVSADGMTKTVQSNSYVAAPVSSTDVTAVQADDSTIETETDYSGSTKVGQTVTTTSANGLSKTVKRDDNGDGTFDTTTSDTVSIASNGSRTETLTETDGTLQSITGGYTESETVVTVTSANGLSKTVTTTGTNGQTSIAHSGAYTKTINADGSTTATDTETIGSAKDLRIVTDDRTGLTVTTQLSTAGSSTFDRTDALATGLDGSTKETITNLHGDGTAEESETKTVSADGRTKTIIDMVSEAGIVDDAQEITTPGTDGSFTTVATDSTSAGTLLDKRITSVSADGLGNDYTLDTNGDGIADEGGSDVTVLNADGSRTETLLEQDTTGAQLDKQTLTTSADGLTTSLATAAGGATLFTATSQAVNNPNGSTTDTTTSVNAQGVEFRKTVVNTSADGRTVDETYDLNGDGTTDIDESTITSATGAVTTVDTYYNTSGAVTSTTTTKQSADGRDITISRQSTAHPTTNTLETTLISADGSGSYSFTQQSSTNAYLVEADHLVDGNGVDTVTLVNGGTTTTYKIAVAQESEDLARVEGVYAVTLGRTMSTVESQTWLKYYSTAGLNEVQLATDLMASSEFTTEYGTLTDAAFVDRLYVNALGRQPDAAEAATWTTELGSGAIMRSALVVDLSRIANAPDSNQQLTLKSLEKFLPKAGSGGAPNEISVTDSSGVTTNNYYNEDTGVISATTQFSSKGIETSSTTYQAEGQVSTVASYNSTGLELQNEHMDVATGAIVGIDVFNTGDVVSQSGIAITTANGSSATVNASNDTISVGANATLSVTGSTDAIAISPSSDTKLTVNGSGITINGAGGNDAVTVEGNGSSVTIGGTTTVELGAANQTLTLTGTGSVVTVDAQRAGFVIYASDTTINTRKGVSVTIIGSNDRVNTMANSSSTITVEGMYDTVASTGNTVDLDGNNTVAYVQGANTVYMNGNNESLNGDGSADNIYGTAGNIENIHTDNSTIYIQNPAYWTSTTNVSGSDDIMEYFSGNYANQYGGTSDFYPGGPPNQGNPSVQPFQVGKGAYPGDEHVSTNNDPTMASYVVYDTHLNKTDANNGGNPGGTGVYDGPAKKASVASASASTDNDSVSGSSGLNNMIQAMSTFEPQAASGTFVPASTQGTAPTQLACPGRVVQRDLAKAAALLRAAAAKGERSALSNVAHFFETGQVGYRIDPVPACALYTVAAEKGKKNIAPKALILLSANLTEAERGKAADIAICLTRGGETYISLQCVGDALP